MKKLILPIGIVSMMLLLAAAYTWDSVRTATSARDRVAMADDEMKKQEDRLLKLLAESSKTSPEVEAAVAAYKSAPSQSDRHAAYEQMVASFEKTMSSKIDPTNPLERKFMDNIAGAMNRRDVTQKVYDSELAAYNDLLGGFRGRIARRFSSSLETDSSSPGKP